MGTLGSKDTTIEFHFKQYLEEQSAAGGIFQKEKRHLYSLNRVENDSHWMAESSFPSEAEL